MAAIDRGFHSRAFAPVRLSSGQSVAPTRSVLKPQFSVSAAPAPRSKAVQYNHFKEGPHSLKLEDSLIYVSEQKGPQKPLIIDVPRLRNARRGGARPRGYSATVCRLNVASSAPPPSLKSHSRALRHRRSCFICCHRIDLIQWQPRPDLPS